jgi:hypothetical protein
MNEARNFIQNMKLHNSEHKKILIQVLKYASQATLLRLSDAFSRVLSSSVPHGSAFSQLPQEAFRRVCRNVQISLPRARCVCTRLTFTHPSPAFACFHQLATESDSASRLSSVEEAFPKAFAANAVIHDAMSRGSACRDARLKKFRDTRMVNLFAKKRQKGEEAWLGRRT